MLYVLPSQLPMCTSPKIQRKGHIGPILKNVTENCWQKVVTDYGVCFSNTGLMGELGL